MFRKGARSPSLGGSPATADEDIPLEPSIPVAVRTHVERPLRFNAGRESASSLTDPPLSGFRAAKQYGGEYDRR